ncbi:MAG: GHKL domain-containing protein, partial [Bacilli bacterium]
SNIYSLFGNAIDNAIEYLLKKDMDKRFIRLHVKGINDMISIHIENYCDDDIQIVDGLPKTTKADKLYHGFGTISMKKIVESYDGEIFLKRSDSLFVVNILIPIKENK